VIPRVEPVAVAYCSHFYASHHIPSYNRPGNNTVNSDDYKKYNIPDNSAAAAAANIYNIECHTNTI
jgi:hypothetical protein